MPDLSLQGPSPCTHASDLTVATSEDTEKPLSPFTFPIVPLLPPEGGATRVGNFYPVAGHGTIVVMV